jgi:hypothetical protein
MYTASLVKSHSEKAESSWNVMAHDDAREGKWRGNWRIEWVANTLHTTSEHGVSSITKADAHTSVANSRLNWNPRRFKWTRPFRRKTKSDFYGCVITFQTQSTCYINARVYLQNCCDFSLGIMEWCFTQLTLWRRNFFKNFNTLCM